MRNSILGDTNFYEVTVFEISCYPNAFMSCINAAIKLNTKIMC